MRLSRAAFTREVQPPKLLPRRPIFSASRDGWPKTHSATASRFATLPLRVVSSILPSLSPQPCVIEPAARDARGLESRGEGDVLGAVFRAYQAVREDHAGRFARLASGSGEDAPDPVRTGQDLKLLRHGPSFSFNCRVKISSRVIRFITSSLLYSRSSFNAPICPFFTYFSHRSMAL